MRRVPTELLAEGDWHSVHQMRAPHLDDIGKLLRLAGELLSQMLQRRNQSVLNLQTTLKVK